MPSFLVKLVCRLKWFKNCCLLCYSWDKQRLLNRQHLMCYRLFRFIITVYTQLLVILFNFSSLMDMSFWAVLCFLWIIKSLNTVLDKNVQISPIKQDIALWYGSFSTIILQLYTYHNDCIRNPTNTMKAKNQHEVIFLNVLFAQRKHWYMKILNMREIYKAMDLVCQKSDLNTLYYENYPITNHLFNYKKNLV